MKLDSYPFSDNFRLRGQIFRLVRRLASITISLVSIALSICAVQTDITGPGGSGQFGLYVTALPNGNFVVVDPLYDDGATADVGAVYLYNGTTLALISTLKGSTANDKVGSRSGFNGIVVLANGNFIVSSTTWDNGALADAGAATWCSKTTGCNGVVSASNSLVGGSAGDQVGSAYALTNGNYVTAAPAWDNPAGPIADVGAVTWCNGTTGRVGLVTAATSLIGGAAGNYVGNGGIRALTNGNYVADSYLWDNPVGPVADVGAVTWGNGATGTTGLVSSANSIIGSTVNDQVGSTSGNRIVALTNGNYVVPTQNWDNPSGPVSDVGAVTWCNGSTGGTVGPVSAANSLIGGTSSDWVGVDGVTALTNGNYVVNTAINWRDPATNFSVGAVTWGNGNGGTVGLVSSSNSLVGARSLDRVGIGGIVALTNGNYVVSSYGWDNPTGPVSNVGAVTLGNGNGGTVGLVTTSNSLVGGRADDAVPSSITGLSNGNYVVGSANWDNPSGPLTNVGASTWCNGTTGRTGLVTTANSVVGTKSGDGVGGSSTALANGNYVIGSGSWQNGSFIPVGAATWANGTTGLTGNATTANSLLGSTNGDGVGAAIALTNGNYVVNSPVWDAPGVSNAGNATWATATGLVGTVSTSNSLYGGTANDSMGGYPGVFALANGNYIVRTDNWDNPSGPIANVGAITLGNGTTGTTGLLSSSNSVFGTVSGAPTMNYSFNDARNYLIVGRAASNIVTILSNSAFTATTAGNFNAPATWGGSLPGGLDTATIPNGTTVSVPPSGGSNFAGLINVNGTINGTGTLNGNLSGNSGGTIAPGTSPGILTINGNAMLNSGATFAAEINGVTVGTQYDQLKVNGTVTIDNATLTPTFGFTPVAGNVFKIIDNDSTDSIAGTFNGRPEGSSVLVGSGLLAKLSYRGGDGNDVTYTVFAPTAATTFISGRVTTPDGGGLRNAIVSLTDAGGVSSIARTGPFGYYSFAVEAGQTFVVSVSSKQFVFAPRVVTVGDEMTEVDFAPQ